MFHLTCLTYYVFIMAFILSLFSDAEMTGASTPAIPVASSVSVPKQDPADGLSSDWVQGFQTNPVEERERMGVLQRFSYNPCIDCEYRGLCDEDYCAMMFGPIDMSCAPTRRGWENFEL